MAKFDKVTILNYNPHYVFIPVQEKTYTLPPCLDEDIPTQVTLSFSEVEFVNSQSDVFRNGFLMFKHENPKTLYDALHIDNYANILTNLDIKNILLHPTVEGLQRIIDIRDLSTFDRVRTVFIALKNSTNVDLSNRVIKIVEARYGELRKRIYNTEIIIQHRDTQNNNIESDEVKNLREQVEMMKQMMEEMMKINKEKDKE